MLQNLIDHHKNNWLNTNDCTILPIMSYIRQYGRLREPQIDAIETYLFLKIKGENKPLWQLFAEGFFMTNEDLNRLNISQISRAILEQNTAARALFEFSRLKIKNGSNTTTLLPELEKYIINHAETIDYIQVIKDIFYGISYTDYLFSLPMGAGKTFLMAAIIYLDLYFAENEPENRIFAHNFIILVPSGLKSSIIPSIKTIEKFDPLWVIPEPAASNLKKQLKFEVLDQSKKSSQEKKQQNPNANKIGLHQPFDTLKGLVMVVNAEKVILDRLELTAQGELIEKTADEKDKQANALRNIISKIPNLQIHIDEVHHAATDDIKLRQVVSSWNKNGTINSVLGYSGTPYLSSADKINVAAGVQLKFTQITNTAYYYPLTTAIQKFLKKPRIEKAFQLTSLQIIERGVRDFWTNYENTVYGNGVCAKLAIYCSSIKKLEDEVYPFLIGEMNIAPDLILKYHKGNKDFKIPQANETEFVALDTPFSKKKIVLLVQVGKEGWDCKSLTGVILSQKGDCPTNMVLQTSCRCLRQVDAASDTETALIWLNEDNAQALDKQLKDEQQTSIAEINNLTKGDTANTVERFARLDFLKLPKIDFYQLQVEYTTLIVEDTTDTTTKIAALNPKKHFKQAVIVQQKMLDANTETKDFLTQIRGEPAHFTQWLFAISKGSFNTITLTDLKPLEAHLIIIFNTITLVEDDTRYFNDLYDLDQIQADIRLVFHTHRTFETKTDIIKQSAQMLIVEKLHNTADHNLLYPSVAETAQILHIDEVNTPLEIDETATQKAYQIFMEVMTQQGMSGFAPKYDDWKKQYDFSPTVKAKNQTFHYLPYNFAQSAFELQFLKEVLKLKQFSDLNLEIYYNGDRELTDFKILCYAKKGKSYQRIGYYTPDFLIIQRTATEITKILIVETKGSGFAEQTAFVQRKQFMQTDFLRLNNDKFGYNKFQFLLLQDDLKINDNLAIFNTEIVAFFK